MNAEVKEIARVLDERPELKELIESFENLPKKDQELVFDKLLDILSGNKSNPDEENQIHEKTASDLVDLMEDDEFLDMLYNPLFAFTSWIDNINENPESYKKEADEYRGGFRNKFSEDCHDTPLETMYAAFAFGFDQSTKTTIALLKNSHRWEQPDHKTKETE